MLGVASGTRLDHHFQQAVHEETNPHQVPLRHVAVETYQPFGAISVYIQGDLDCRRDGCVFMTMHDIGSNHESWVYFTQHESMASITEKAVFLHVVVPGQDRGEPDLGQEHPFPSIEELALSILPILDELRVPQVIGLGCGAGANIMVRFALLHPERLHGIIAFHPTASAATVLERLKDRFGSFKLDEMAAHGKDTDAYLVFHKFGHALDGEKNKEEAISMFKNRLHRDINPRNLNRYVLSFMNRTDILEQIRHYLQIDCLLVAGSRSSFVKDTEAMFKEANLKNASLLKIDDIGDVLNEAQDKAAEAILLFCQGLGLLPGIEMKSLSRRGSLVDEPKVPNNRRRMSMQEADIPDIRRLSLAS